MQTNIPPLVDKFDESQTRILLNGVLPFLEQTKKERDTEQKAGDQRWDRKISIADFSYLFFYIKLSTLIPPTV